MIAYEAIGPNAVGDYMVAYATPGAPHVTTVAGICSSKQTAQDECARRNEQQVLERRSLLIRKANMIARDLPKAWP